MRKLLTPREKELLAIISPYVSVDYATDTNVFREDTPDEVKKAYEEFMELGREEMEHMYDPFYW